MGWPVLLQYKARVLKMYLDDVAAVKDAEVHEELLTQYLLVGHAAASRAIQQLEPDAVQETERTVFQTYELDDGTLVPIRQKVDFSDVGEAMWPASVAMAELLLAAPDWVRGKRVVELGCGVGFTGIVLGKRGRCKSLVLTDYSEGGLALLGENLLLNELSSPQVDTALLDWTTADPAAPPLAG